MPRRFNFFLVILTQYYYHLLIYNASLITHLSTFFWEGPFLMANHSLQIYWTKLFFWGINPLGFFSNDQLVISCMVFQGPWLQGFWLGATSLCHANDTCISLTMEH